jgi:hypothetical protein
LGRRAVFKAAFKTRIGLETGQFVRNTDDNGRRSRRQIPVFVYIVAMAQISQISSISKLHGKTARVVELAITIKSLVKTITPKTITKR